MMNEDRIGRKEATDYFNGFGDFGLLDTPNLWRDIHYLYRSAWISRHTFLYGTILYTKHNINVRTFKQRNDYTRSAKAIIAKYGNQRIKHMRIHRQPPSAFLMAALNLFTLGDFQRRFCKTPYDKLFHLRVDLYMEDGNVIGGKTTLSR